MIHGQRSNLTERLFWSTALFFALFFLVAPSLLIIVTAFRPNVEVLAKPPIFLPQSPTLINFQSILGLLPTPGIQVYRYFWNSMVVSITSTLIALIVGTMGGYAFARFRFRGKGAIFLFLMLARAVPGIALSLPIFILWSRLGLIDTQLGLIIVYLVLNIPFTVWLTEGFFRQIPVDLAEAAQIDGCTRWQAFWRVEFPLAKGGLAAAAIFAFLLSWNEYALAAQLTRSQASKTMPVSLLDFTSQFTVDWAGMCALAVIIILPALVLTFAAQRYLIAGLTFGGVKG
jgi:multiple sugar transport system permease protein